MNAAYLRMLRPAQWLKNLMVFFPPLLAGQLLSAAVFVRGMPLLIAFCMVSSAGYILNDLLDRERDRHHPVKCLRPLASGSVGYRSALAWSLALYAFGFFVGWFSVGQLVVYLVGYAVVTLLYSMILKNIPILDLFGISAGFLIRLHAGGELYQIEISPWLFLTVFLLSIFLSTGKRLSEFQILGKNAGDHRASLLRYPDGFLAGTMYMTGAVVLVTYAMYALHKPSLVLSVPLCLFGLLRFIFRVNSGKGGDPTEALLKDWQLFMVGLTWLVIIFWSIYL